MNIEEKYMARCIELGKNALGLAAPNPAVGCVLVHNEKIIGEGFTSKYGGPHAEVNAINGVKDKTLFQNAVLYVTLEPCSHFGKTPPCSDFIIKSGIKKIVIGLQDPHDKVAGKGIKKLKDAGCHVSVGILEAQCREHHKRFLTFQEKKRPYIILKWAETQDGFIAPEKSKRSEKMEPYWITSAYSQQLVHQWRTEEQAILVGTRTVLEDNPKLTARKWAGQNPVRIILDRHLKIPDTYSIYNGDSKTIVFTEKRDAPTSPNNIAYRVMDFSTNVANQIGHVLYEEQIICIIVEGGAQTLQTFIDANLWDEARIFRSASNFQKGVAAPKISGTPVVKQKCIDDILIRLRND